MPGSWGGFVAGLGLPLLYIGYLNRGGPGFICTYGVDSSECGERIDPRPWLASGAVLLLGGFALELWAGRRANRRDPAEP